MNGTALLYGRLKALNRQGYLPLVLRFAKVNMFHITVECLISVYMLELFAVLSRFYLSDPTDIPSLLLLVLLPSVTMIPLSIFFGIWCALFFIFRVYSYSQRIAAEARSGGDPEALYARTVKRYRADVIKVHLTGLLFYSFSTVAVPKLLVSFYPHQFEHPLKFVLHMSIIGLVFGIVWNITGIFRNQRLVWHNLVGLFRTPAISARVYADNFRLLLCNAAGSLVSIGFLCTLCAIIIFNIHPSIIYSENFRRLLTEYNFFVLSFAALAAFYIKTGFSLLYSSKNKNVYVFPNLETILKERAP